MFRRPSIINRRASEANVGTNGPSFGPPGGYTKQRSVSFSFNRMFTNMFPQIVTRAAPENLSLVDQDKLHDFQCAMPNPKQLSAATMYIMGVVDNEKLGRRIIEKLVEIGVLREDRNVVSTVHITRYFTHQVYMIPQYSQKLLVHILFIWEEELARWRVLDEEKREINTLIQEERALGGQAQVGHLELRLLEIEGLKKLLPSLRANRTEQRHEDEVLPGYERNNGLAQYPTANVPAIAENENSMMRPTVTV